MKCRYRKHFHYVFITQRGTFLWCVSVSSSGSEAANLGSVKQTFRKLIWKLEMQNPSNARTTCQKLNKNSKCYSNCRHSAEKRNKRSQTHTHIRERGLRPKPSPDGFPCLRRYDVYNLSNYLFIETTQQLGTHKHRETSQRDYRGNRREKNQS